MAAHALHQSWHCEVAIAWQLVVIGTMSGLGNISGKSQKQHDVQLLDGLGCKMAKLYFHMLTVFTFCMQQPTSSVCVCRFSSTLLQKSKAGDARCQSWKSMLV
jgi:hypothetical protein